MPEKTKEKTVLCTLKVGGQPAYGHSFRKGESGKIYAFRVGKNTLVLESDLPGLQDKNSAQYERYLCIAKNNKEGI